ncbi:MAG: AAA family ATPase, partial [Gammaproteobacteria bacterium]|nr:AAA family ATPase [Gammaproteobacteria bacterium]
LKPLFEQRKRDGYIRECHGDMHLRNLVWFNDEPLAFDCLEFNADLRWIDTLSEIAFLVMDLQDRKQPVLAQRFLNSYLEHSGDYQGLRIFRFYLVYRALVRAKVDAIRAAQQGLSENEQQAAEHGFRAYLALAGSYMRHALPRLLITRGMSASGKSTLTQPLLERMGAVRIRSDIERKRMFGIDLDADSGAGIEQGIYSAEAGEKTYQRLALLAESVLAAGYNVIVDAAFLKFEQRQLFSSLADTLKIPFIILEFSASADILRQRIRARKGDVSDADLAVLEHQLATVKPLHDEELNSLISVDTEQEFDAQRLYQQIKALSRDDDV